MEGLGPMVIIFCFIAISIVFMYSWGMFFFLLLFEIVEFIILGIVKIIKKIIEIAKNPMEG